MSPTQKNTGHVWQSAEHRRTVIGVVTVVAISILFDGYDLVVYGTVLPVLLENPGEIGALSAETGGTLGSLALIGMMIGALSVGAVGDYIGRRRVMLVAIVWFSAGMALTAMTTSQFTFGALRLLTGIGIGAVVATGAAIIAEFAPAGRRNLYNAIVYSGIPAGGVMASGLGMLFRDAIGWRGMFLIGALPIVILLPLAWRALPESPRWLISRGRADEARRVAAKYALPLEADAPAPAEKDPSAAAPDRGASEEPTGFRAIFSSFYFLPTLLLGMMSFSGLLMTYGLNTWLPQIMENYGIDPQASLAFLLVLNGGAIVGGLAASMWADRVGVQIVVSMTFVVAAVSMVCLTLGLPIGVMYLLIAFAGVGSIGTQVLIYGFVANFYSTRARGAGVAWCAGFGRLGGILGPVVGGLLVGAGLGSSGAFYFFAGIAVFGALVTFTVPRNRTPRDTVIASSASGDAERRRFTEPVT